MVLREHDGELALVSISMSPASCRRFERFTKVFELRSNLDDCQRESNSFNVESNI